MRNGIVIDRLFVGNKGMAMVFVWNIRKWRWCLCGGEESMESEMMELHA